VVFAGGAELTVPMDELVGHVEGNVDSYGDAVG
jgi:hypothetical protein